jgi:protein arginine kinase activator
MLKGMHKGTTHTGKVPQRLLKARLHAEELKRLQRELRKAVDDEKYEAAAELRDKIKHFEPGAAEN